MEKKVTETMRLDKFLKTARLLKRRSVANEACGAGKVDVNGRPAKPACSVKVGDIISLTLGGVKQNYKILLLKLRFKKDDASTMYAQI
jgi:ribosomal 50S subunit-recycling heat shock protein